MSLTVIRLVKGGVFHGVFELHFVARDIFGLTCRRC